MRMYEIFGNDYIGKKDKLKEVFNILHVGYNERKNGDVYAVLKNGEEDLLLNKYIWNIIENDNKEVIGVCLYNNSDNISRKISLISVKSEFEDGKWVTSQESKEALNMLLDELRPENKEKLVWGEVSGAIEHIVVKKREISKPLPIDEAITVMTNKNKLVTKDEDGIHYKREIGIGENGLPLIESKVIVGNPPKYLLKQNNDFKRLSKLIEKNYDDKEAVYTLIDNIKDDSIKEKLQKQADTYYEKFEKADGPIEVE